MNQVPAMRSAALKVAKAFMDEDPGVHSGLYAYRVALLRVFYPWQS